MVCAAYAGSVLDNAFGRLGYEDREAIYGYEPWRLEKVRGLKRKYDPHGRFNFYLPIERKVEVEDGGKTEL